MFHTHQLAIGSMLSATGNVLIMVFRSVSQKLKKRRPRPRWRSPMMAHQQLRWIRTTVLGRTPGWSPPHAAVGPWQPLWIQRAPRLAISSLKMHTGVIDKIGTVNFQCQLEGFTPHHSPSNYQLELILENDQQQWTAPLELASDLKTFAASYQLNQVQLWWPHTHGNQALYTAKLRIMSDTKIQSTEFDLGRLGFRTIQVEREQSNFSININGTAIFCRGASWMPLDSTSLQSTAEDYLTALMQVKAAGMNMLRISGTSCYETDLFYSLCDQLGILIWQEFMFAGMDYPDDSEFVASVKIEAQQQLARWQTHPSLTVICGNAEVEQQAAMWGAERSLWQSDLFYDELPKLVKEWCPEVFYWPSAGHEGAFPHQCDTGTAFYYGFGAYLKPSEDTRSSSLRFATECLAIANIPETENLKLLPGDTQSIPKVHHPSWKSRSPRDLGGAGWDFDDIRDYYLAQYFKVDPLQLRYTDYERYLKLSKVTSGEMMAEAFSEWRSSRSSCQGALIWFLRDLWPSAGWGVIDSQGQPKSSYYYLKRVLQPIAVSLSNEGSNGYYVHIINEHPEPITVTAELWVYQAGHIAVENITRTINLAARENLSQPLVQWFDRFLDLNYSYRFGPAFADSLYLQLKADNGDILAETFALPLGFSSIPQSDIGLEAQLTSLDDGNVEVNITCQSLALAVYFEIEGFIPDDAYFHLAPKHSKKVILRNQQSERKSLYGSLTAINALTSIPLSITAE
jgi:beta-mannosidase